MDDKVKVLKAKVMLWTDVSFHDMEVIDKMLSIPDLESALCSVFRVDLPEPKREVLLELYVQTVLFSREHNLKKEQTSALLSIIKSIHEINTETPFNKIEQCLKYCKELLLCHSVRRPPFSINLFSFEQADCILKYIYKNYLRHYKLYKYIFTPQVKLDLSVTYSGITDHGSTIVKDSSMADVENAMEKDAELKETVSSETQKTSSTDISATSSDSMSDLKTLIEQEVRQQMKLVSGKLDQTIREKEFQHNELNSSQTNHKTKK